MWSWANKKSAIKSSYVFLKLFSNFQLWTRIHPTSKYIEKNKNGRHKTSINLTKSFYLPLIFKLPNELEYQISQNFLLYILFVVHSSHTHTHTHPHWCRHFHQCQIWYKTWRFKLYATIRCSVHTFETNAIDNGYVRLHKYIRLHDLIASGKNVCENKFKFKILAIFRLF